MSGENNSFYGKRHSVESRRRMSESHKGKTLSDEHRRNLSKARIGLRHTDETKKKMSIAQSGKNHPFYGKKHTKKTKRKMSNSRIGKQQTDETKRKLSMIMMGKNNPMYGKHHTDETKRKLREDRLSRVFSNRNTSIEVTVQGELDRRGIVYDTHVPVCGVCIPDVVFLRQKVVVQCDGNHWHSKDFDNGKVWRRDRRQDRVLRENGWEVLRFWGSEINDDVSRCVDIIEGVLG